jgi:hypothetical protein
MMPGGSRRRRSAALELSRTDPAALWFAQSVVQQDCRHGDVRPVTIASRPPDWQPVLTGCCRDLRTRFGGDLTGALRQAFEAYCDDACARVCPMLRGIRNPDRILHGTAYEPLDAGSPILRQDRQAKVHHSPRR